MKTYKKMTYFFIFLVIISVLMRPIMLYETAAKEVAYFDKGVLNVSKLDFDKGLYLLKGNVAVTTNQLIDPAKDHSDSAGFENLPFVWRAKDGVTHGSYQFKLEGLEKGKAYGFYLL